MIKSKIAFTGFMGAILMSAGMTSAGAVSIATQGYVEQEIGKIQQSVDDLQENSVSSEDLDNLDKKYEVLTNKVTSFDDVNPEDMATKYPTVGAVMDAMPVLTEAEKAAITALTGDTGLIQQVNGVKADVDTLNGDDTVTGSVANQIAGAVGEIKNADGAAMTVAAALDKKQDKSSAAYSMGNEEGGWTVLTSDEQAVLASGITAEKVAVYDAIAVDGSEIAEIQTTVSKLDDDINDAENGLKKIVAEQAMDIADNADSIAKNAQDIAKKITMPGECASGNSTCVLMVSNGTISWTPVTDPVED